MDDAAVPHLCKRTGLKTLTLGGNRITARGGAAIKKAIPGCAIANP